MSQIVRKILSPAMILVLLKRISLLHPTGMLFHLEFLKVITQSAFVMIGYDKDDYWKDAPAIADGNYNLWRLMIDKNYQNRGYGKQAVELALRFIRTFPCGKADFCWLSYEPENAAAKSLYASFGFIETGEKDGEKQLARMTASGQLSGRAKV